MIQIWLQELGAKITESIYDHLGPAGGHYGEARTDELVFKYTWEEVWVAWRSTFGGRWSIGHDWHFFMRPWYTRDDVARLLRMCLELGELGYVPALAVTEGDCKTMCMAHTTRIAGDNVRRELQCPNCR